MREQVLGRSRFAIGVDAHHSGAAIFPPEIAAPHFDRDARQFGREHGLFVVARLAVKHGGAGHGDHTHGYAALRQQLLRLHGQLHLAAGGNDDGLRSLVQPRARRLGQHIGATRDQAGVVFVHVGHVLAAQQHGRGAFVVLQRGGPGNGGLYHIAGAPYVQVRYQAQAGCVLDALVRGAVFAQADAIVREDVDDAQLHQRGHADGVAAVVAEGEEGAAIRDIAAVQGNAVHDGGHAEFAHAIVDVAAGLGAFAVACFVGEHFKAVVFLDDRAIVGKAQRRRVLRGGEVGAGEVCAAAQQLGHVGGKALQRHLAGLAGSGSGRMRLVHARHALGQLLHHGGHSAAHAAAQLACQQRKLLDVIGKQCFPLGLIFGALLLGIPRPIDFLRHLKGSVRPAQVFAHQRDFFGAQRLAMRLGCINAVGAAFANMRFADDERGLAA